MGIVLLFNLAGFIYYVHFAFVNGYLPSPFLYDKSDTFMDLFNPMYWAYNDGRYTDWGSVYPPLNYFILKCINFVFAGEAYSSPALMRDNAPYIIAGFCLIYFMLPALVIQTKLWQEFSKIEKFLIYFVIILSAPMLFTLERGNLILLAPILLALALSKTGMTRNIYVAILINLKPYFALLLIYYFARKKWKELAICTMFSGLIFVITGLALDSHFYFFFTNLFNFSQETGLHSLREVMALPSSISAFSYVLRNPSGASFVSGHLNSVVIAILIHFVEAIKWSVIAISLAALFMKSKQMHDTEVFTLLIVIICNLGVWVGGYTFILYIALIPVLIKMRAKWLYVGLISFIAIPLDAIPLLGNFIGEQYSYLAAANVNVWWTLALGSIVRPVLNIILLLTLSGEFLTRKLLTYAVMSH